MFGDVHLGDEMIFKMQRSDTKTGQLLLWEKGGVIIGWSTFISNKAKRGEGLPCPFIRYSFQLTFVGIFVQFRKRQPFFKALAVGQQITKPIMPVV